MVGKIDLKVVNSRIDNEKNIITYDIKIINDTSYIFSQITVKKLHLVRKENGKTKLINIDDQIATIENFFPGQTKSRTISLLYNKKLTGEENFDWIYDSKVKKYTSFLTNIRIKELRHLENIPIKIGDKKKHLIITGINGSGKTSLLETLHKELTRIVKSGKANVLKRKETDYIKYNNVIPVFNEYNSLTYLYNKNDFVIEFYDVNRKFENEEVQGISKINENERTMKYFFNYLVNLKYLEMFYENESNKKKEIIVKANKIEKWFKNFEKLLKRLFNNKTLELIYVPESLRFEVKMKNRKNVGFNELPHGYSSILTLVSDLIMKIKKEELVLKFDTPGIVLIDELELHLHVELQKEIFKALEDFFPNIQFIVSTHSPFIINSNVNATVYDLENKVTIENMSNYSYQAVIENFFNINQYRNELIEKLDRYEKLLEEYLKLKKEKDDNFDLIDELEELRKELETINRIVSPEVYDKFKQLEIKRVSNV